MKYIRVIFTPERVNYYEYTRLSLILQKWVTLNLN